MLVEQITARPGYRGGAIAKRTDLFAFEFARMIHLAGTVKDVALARPALKEHRQRQKALALLLGAHQRRCRHLGDIEFALDKTIMHFPRRILVADILEIVTVERYQSVNQSAIARIRIGRESDFRFVCHDHTPLQNKNSVSPRRHEGEEKNNFPSFVIFVFSSW